MPARRGRGGSLIFEIRIPLHMTNSSLYFQTFREKRKINFKSGSSSTDPLMRNRTKGRWYRVNKTLEKELVERYPTLYQDYGGDPKQICMSRGFEHGDGWFRIIEELSAKLDTIARKCEITIIADQVKEKFGTLRFYYGVSGLERVLELEENAEIRVVESETKAVLTMTIRSKSPKVEKIYQEIHSAIKDAEELTRKTCMFCGNAGSLRTKLYWHVSCDKCEKEYLAGAKRPR